MRHRRPIFVAELSLASAVHARRAAHGVCTVRARGLSVREGLRGFPMKAANKLILFWGALAAATALTAACGSTQSQPGKAPPPAALTPTQEGPGSLTADDVLQFQPVDKQPGSAGSAASRSAGDAAMTSTTNPLGAPSAAVDLCADGRAPGTGNPSQGTCAKCSTMKPIKIVDPGSKMIDLLVIQDTSPSLSPNRQEIAKHVETFISKLPANADLQIGVMLAHSDTDLPRVGGNRGLARASSHRGGQLFGNIIRSRDGGGRANMSAVAQALVQQLSNPPLDLATDGGEAGLLSLNLAMTKYYDANHAKGFFRDSATLAVMFISDENDVCAENYYPDDSRMVNGISVHNKESTVAATRGGEGDPTPIEQRAHDFYCSGAEGQPAVNPASVYAAILQRKTARQVMISAIVYHPGDEEGQPIPEQPAGNSPDLKYWHEKDFGHGYVELVKLARQNGGGGALGDMAASDYTQGLAIIGQAAAERLRLTPTRVPLEGGILVDPNVLCLTANVGGGVKEIRRVDQVDYSNEGLSFVYDEKSRSVEVFGSGAIAPRAGAKIEINGLYCEPPTTYALRTDDVTPQANIDETRRNHYPALLRMLDARGPYGACASARDRIQRLGR